MQLWHSLNYTENSLFVSPFKESKAQVSQKQKKKNRIKIQKQHAALSAVKSRRVIQFRRNANTKMI